MIFITEKDRNENTKVLCEAQRPYLDISFACIKSRFFKNNYDKKIIFEHGTEEDQIIKHDEYLTLIIKNNGASVAIIDTNNTKISICYQIENEMIEKELGLDFAIERLSVKSGESVYIKIVEKDLYDNGKLAAKSRITQSKVYYKDLFNKRYFDECKLEKCQKVLHDNERIDDN